MQTRFDMFGPRFSVNSRGWAASLPSPPLSIFPSLAFHFRSYAGPRGREGVDGKEEGKVGEIAPGNLTKRGGEAQDSILPSLSPYGADLPLPPSIPFFPLPGLELGRNSPNFCEKFLAR